MPYVGPPDDVDSSIGERGRQASCLRIVKKNDVLGLNEIHHAPGIGLSNPGIMGYLLGTELTAIANSAV